MIRAICVYLGIGMLFTVGVVSFAATELPAQEKLQADNEGKPCPEIEEEYRKFYDTFFEELGTPDDFPFELMNKWIPLINEKCEENPRKFSLQTFLIMEDYRQKRARSVYGMKRIRLFGIILYRFFEDTLVPHLFNTFIEDYSDFSELERRRFTPFFNPPGEKNYRARFFPLKSMEDINKIPQNYMKFLMDRDAWRTLQEFATVFPDSLKLEELDWAKELYEPQGAILHWGPDTVLQHKKEAEIAALADKLNAMLQSPHWPIQFWALKTIGAFSKLKERDYTYPSENLHPLVKRQLEVLNSSPPKEEKPTEEK